MLTLKTTGETRTHIPGMTKRLNNAEPAIVPMPTSKLLKKITAYSATKSSGSEDAIASKVAPFTERGSFR